MSLCRTTRSRLRAASKDRESRADLWRAMAAAETNGTDDLEVLSRRHDDADVRSLAKTLAITSRQHAALLEAHATTASNPPDHAGTPPFDFCQGRGAEDRNRRGYPAAHCAHSIDTISCLATLQNAIESSIVIYQACATCFEATDSAGASACDSILRDLRRHVEAVKQALAPHGERSASQVREALRAARRSPFMARWKRTGMHSGAGFSRGFLYVLYYTVLAPFGLLARRSTVSNKDRASAASGASDPSQLTSQY